MAFNAGAIEATLTVDRNPFTAGLRAAKAQAQKFASDKIEGNVTVSVKYKTATGAAQEMRTKISQITGTANVKLTFAKGAATEIRQKIRAIEANAKVGLGVDGKELTKVKQYISNIRGNIQLDVNDAKLQILNQRLREISAKATKAEVEVDVKAGQLLAVEERLRQLALQTTTAEVGVRLKEAQLQLAEERIRQLAARSPEIAIDFDIKTAKLLMLEEQMLQLEQRRAEIPIDFDIKQAKLMKLEQELLLLEARVVEISIDFDIKSTKLGILREQLNQLRLRQPQIQIDFDIKEARLRLLQAQLQRLESTETNHRVNVNTFGARGQMRLLLVSIAAFAPSIGSAIIALTGLIGALTSAFGIAAAGLAAFGAVGFSVFSKIKDYAKDSAEAVKAQASAANAVASAQSQLATVIENAKQRQAQAARSVADAERNLADAYEAAAQSAIQANRRVEAAERGVISSKRAYTRAQEDLKRAVEETKEELEDLQLSLRGAALSEEQAVIDLAEAQKALAKARAEGASADEIRQLDLDVRKAALSLDEAKERYIDLQQESANFAENGINGQRRVRDATEAVGDAAQGVQDAERDLADARAEATRDALQSQRAIQDAERDLADARDEARQATIEAQRDIADAQRAVAEAQAGYAEAQLKQLEALSPAVSRAQQSLESLKKTYEDLVRRTQDPVADAFTANFKAAETFLKTLDPIVVAVADSFERIGGQIDRYFSSKHWQDFVGFISENAGPTIQNFFDIFAYGTRAVMSIIRAFDPLADRVLPAIATGLRDFSVWLDEISGTPEFQAFLDLAAESLEKFWWWLVAVVEFIFKLSEALAPFGNVLFDIFTKVFNALSDMDPAVLAALAEGLFAIVGALILGASGPIALAAGLIFGLGAALAYLYENNENVRTAVDNLVKSISDKLQPAFERIGDAWEDKVKPAWDGLVGAINDHILPALEDLWKQFEEKVLPAVGDLATTFVEDVIPGFLDFFRAVSPILGWLIRVLGTELIDTLEIVVRVFDGTFQILGGLLKLFAGIFTLDWEKMGEGLGTISEGFWTIIAGIFGMSLDELKDKFQEWDRQLSNEWAGFWGGVIEEQDGSQREVNGAWNDFWTGVGNYLSEETRQMNNDWVEYWGGMITEQDGSQTYVEGEWNAFWGRVHQAAYDFEVMMDNNWASFWGGVITEQDGSQTVVEGSWNTFWNDIGAWFDGAVTNMRQGWNDFWAGFEQMCREGVINVGNAFRAIANYFRDPINWVINVVLNDGILGGWNTVMGWIGADLLKVNRIPELPAFAEGGKITGGTPNKDSVPIMTMPGEYVFSKRAIANMGGLNVVDQIHKAARTGNVIGNGVGTNDGLARQHLMRAVPMMDDGGLRKYAYGGVQPHVAAAGQEIERIFGRLPGGIGGVGARANASDHPSGHALDFMTLRDKPLGDRITAHLMQNAQRMAVKYLIWQQAINQGGGWRGMEDRGSPTANHFDHVHASFLRAGQPGKGFGGGLPAGGGGFFANMWEMFGGQVTGLFNGLLNFASMPGFGSPIGNAITQIPIKVVEKTIAQAQKKLTAMVTDIFGGPGKTPGGAPAKGPVVDQVKAVAARYGWGEGPEWAALSQLIQKESSWNPNAANPNSSARGLFQKMTSIHGPVEPTPAGQAEWGLNYIKGRYGTPSAALAFHNRNNYYDTGGLLPPGVSPVNMSGEVERVLSPKQTNDFARLVVILEDLIGTDGALVSSGGDVFNFYITESERMTAADVLEEANFKIKRVKRGGIYE
jgi:hypothetical protein